MDDSFFVFYNNHDEIVFVSVFREPDLWAEVLQETNEYRRQLIDQVNY